MSDTDQCVLHTVHSRIEFQRNASGEVVSLTWSRDGAPARTARRVNIERHEDVRFSNGDVQLAGRLISPTSQGPHPATTSPETCWRPSSP